MSTKKSAPQTEKKAVLHPRNRHQGRYDFPAMINASPELAAFVIINPYGKQSIDFANPDAVKAFNRALLQQSTAFAAGIFRRPTCAHRYRGGSTTCTTWPTCWALAMTA